MNNFIIDYFRGLIICILWIYPIICIIQIFLPIPSTVSASDVQIETTSTYCSRRRFIPTCISYERRRHIQLTRTN